MFSKLKAVFIAVASTIVSCGSDSAVLYCNNLQERLKNEDFVILLEQWAIDHIFRSGLIKDDVKFEGRMIPGFYRYYGKQFDWDAIRFDSSKSQVRIVGPRPQHVVEERVDNVKAVFFAERSRVGFIVKAETAEDYGVGSDSKYLISVSDNVAVLCIPSD